MIVTRQRSPDSINAEKDYRKSNGTVKLVDLARKYNVAPGTVRSWKSRYKWDDNIDEDVAALEKAKKKQRNVAKKEKEKKVKKIEKKINETIEDADLTEKQRLFCIYYIKSFNATQAYLKAYNCTYNTASVEGHRLLTNPKVKKEIDKLKELKRQSIMIGEDDIVEQYMRIAFADITDFIEFGQKEVPITDKEGNYVTSAIANVVNFKDGQMVDGQLIKEVKKGKQGISIKLEDKMKALEWLANYFDINPDSKHKKIYDNARLQLKREELEFKKEQEAKKNW